jgi:hypothetical protein
LSRPSKVSEELKREARASDQNRMTGRRGSVARAEECGTGRRPELKSAARAGGQSRIRIWGHCGAIERVRVES